MSTHPHHFKALFCMNRHHWETRYEELMLSQELCLRVHRKRLERLECCFLESFEATEALVKETLETGFENLEQEIQFFKELKPKFTAEMIFFRMLYHAMLFEPKKDRKEKVL